MQNNSIYRNLVIPKFSQENIQYNSVGNLIGMNLKDPIGESYCEYTYDDLYQIKSEAGMTSQSYVHDFLYNREQKDEISYQHNSLNELLSQGDTFYIYERRYFLYL